MRVLTFFWLGEGEVQGEFEKMMPHIVVPVEQTKILSKWITLTDFFVVRGG